MKLIKGLLFIILLGVGAPRPDWREIETDLMKRCIIYADSKESALAESGNFLNHISLFFCTIIVSILTILILVRYIRTGQENDKI